MGKAKDIRVEPISGPAARRVVKKTHYSGKYVNNSQLHLGVFYEGRLEGAMQFGPSMDKRRMIGLVNGTKWNGFLELNRMAFSEALPRNSESRALGVALRMIRKHRPDIEWIVSFADATQCGDGTIYRAAGFLLTGIKPNNQTWQAPGGETFSRLSLTDGRSKQQQQQQARIVASRTTLTKGKHITEDGAASMTRFKDAGWSPLPGFQIRYIYFTNPDARERLTVPVLPFSAIDEAGAGMYLGEKRAGSIEADAPGDQPGEGGSTPTPALHAGQKARRRKG